MQKALLITLMALALAGCKTQKTEQDPTPAQNVAAAQAGGHLYSDALLDVIADDQCWVSKVNGFAPRAVKQVKADMWQVSTQMDITLSVLKLGPGKCDITWMDEQGHSGILTAK